MENRMNKITAQIEIYDKKIKKLYLYQSGKDIDKFAADYSSWKGNEKFVNELYKFLSQKYPWRHWGVVVFDGKYTPYYQRIEQHGGHQKYGLHGRNIIVGSKGSRWLASPEVRKYAKNLVENFSERYSSCSDVFDANYPHGYNQASFRFSIYGCVRRWTDLWVTGEIFYMKPGRSFSLFLFNPKFKD